MDRAAGWIWRSLPDAADAELAAAIAELDPTVAELAGDEGSWEGTLAALDPALDTLDPAPSASDPTQAAGLVRSGTLPCALDVLAELALVDPAALYPHAFHEWSREWRSPAEDWPGTPRLDWHAAWTGPLGIHTYRARGDGSLRWVEAVPGAPVGRLLLSRGWLAAPAEVDADASLAQDWSLELAWEGEDGATRHAWLLWREADYGLGLDTSDLEIQAALLDGLDRRDRALADACRTSP